jgi:hypothetical protein
MKSINSKLFQDSLTVLEMERLNLVKAGLATGGPGSSSTGDHDCTFSKGSDCGDNNTDGVLDTDVTQVGHDGCKISGGGETGSGYNYGAV